MVFNIESFTFNNLIVDGLIRIDDSIDKTTIIANNIWVRAGKIVAG